mgnify:CR=1 FL=1
MKYRLSAALALAAATALAAPLASAETGDDKVLRVCADPANLPFTNEDACHQVQLNMAMEKKIRDRWYADRLLVITGVPKSASSLVREIMAVIKYGDDDIEGRTFHA